VLAILARYSYHMAGSWRWLYVVTVMISLYLNVLVGVVQAFQKLPLLQPLAPTGTEPPFAVAQGLVLLAFAVLTVLALKRFYPARDIGAVSMKILRAAVPATARGYGTPASRSTKNSPAANKAAPSSTHTGSVSTQARMMLRTVSFWIPNHSQPSCRQYPTTTRASCSPQAEYVGRLDGSECDQFGAGSLRVGQVCLANLLPTVTTMRFQPIMVPKPSASATAILTHSGCSSSDP